MFGSWLSCLPPLLAVAVPGEGLSLSHWDFSLGQTAGGHSMALQHSRVCPCSWELLLAAHPRPAPHSWLYSTGITGVFRDQSTRTGCDPAPEGSRLELGCCCSFGTQPYIHTRFPLPQQHLCPVLAAPTRGPSQAMSRALGIPQPPTLSGSHSSLGSEQGAELSPTESGQSDQPSDRRDSDAGTSAPGKLHPLSRHIPAFGG